MARRTTGSAAAVRPVTCDLIVTLDYVTGRILSAFFCEQEGTASTFRGLAETIEKHGLFSAFYTNRAAITSIPQKLAERLTRTIPHRSAGLWPG
jgi:hypothetical protein